MDPDGLILVIISNSEIPLIGLPKGHKEWTDKTLWECAVRETYEETGIEFTSYIDSCMIGGIQFYISNEQIDANKIAARDKKEVIKALKIPCDSVPGLISAGVANYALKRVIEHIKHIEHLEYSKSQYKVW